MKLNELKQLNEGRLPTSFDAYLMSQPVTKNLNRLLDIKDEIEMAFKNKEILNQRFIFIKERVSRLADDLLEQLNSKYFYGGRYTKLPEEIRDLSFISGTQGIKSIPNKIKKISIKHPLLDDAKKLYDSFKPFIDIIEGLKPLVIKKTEKLAKEREVKDTYQQVLVGHKDVEKVINLLKKETEFVYDKILKEYVDYFQKIVDDFKKSGETDPRKFTKNPNKLYFLMRKKDPEKEAESIVTEILDKFIYKSTRKLAFILNKKNNLKKVKIDKVRWSLGRIEASIYCDFTDNSSFRMDHQIVRVWTAATSFYRYPSTFHNVVMIDGSKMKMPSIEKMEKQFI